MDYEQPVVTCEHCGASEDRDLYWEGQDDGLLYCPECGQPQTEGTQMGALFHNVCYPTQDAARASACSQFDAKVMATTNLYTSECTSTVVTGATMTICKRTNGGACTNVAPPWPVTPVCEVFAPDQFGITPADMSYVYAWGVSAVLALFMVGYAIGAGLTAIRKV